MESTSLNGKNSPGYPNASGAFKGRILRRLRALYHPLRARAILTPKRLWVAPPRSAQSIQRSTDEIRAGYFSFNGKTLRVRDGESIFPEAAPGPDWRRGLLGFSWFRHLREMTSAASQKFLNDFLSIKRFDPLDSVYEPAVVACRLLALLVSIANHFKMDAIQNFMTPSCRRWRKSALLVACAKCASSIWIR